MRSVKRFLYLCLIGLAHAAYALTLPQMPTTIPDVNVASRPSIWRNNNKQVQTTHFSRQDIEQSPVVTLSDFLKQSQSIVRLTNNSGNASDTALSIRGFGDNAAANSLILIDGFPLTNPSLLAPAFNSIPLLDIERIEIIQGSEGTLWGDQAVGGVVNIITRHPKKWFTSMNASAGSFGKGYASLLAGDKLASGFFYKAFGLYNSSANYREHNRTSNHSGAAQAGLDYARGTLSLYVQVYTNRINLPGGLNAEQYHDHPTWASNDVNFAYDKTELLQLLNKHELTSNWLLETRLSYHNVTGNGLVFAPFYRRDELTNLSPRLIGKWQTIKFTAGYEGQLSSYRLLQRQTGSSASANQQHVFLQAVSALSKQFDLTLGARLAKQTNQFINVAGQQIASTDQVAVTEQGLTFKANDRLSFFIRRDGNFSFPKANEQSLLPTNITALKAQTGTSYEAGGEWQSKQARTQLNVYHLTLNNEIAFNPTQTEAQPFGAFTNLDKTSRRGITLTESYRFTQAVWLDSQLNYVDARFATGENVNKRIPAVPALTGNVGLNYAATSNWWLKYALLYNGNRYASENVSNQGGPMPGYWIHDASIQYLIAPVTVSFEVSNVFNQLYPAYAYYNPDTQANTYYPGVGRSYLLTIKVDIA